jgi:hypothetical protein
MQAFPAALFYMAVQMESWAGCKMDWRFAFEFVLLWTQESTQSSSFLSPFSIWLLQMDSEAGWEG